MTTNLLITAYCACHICCGPQSKGIDAIGKKPIQGITTAAPRNIPLGTSIHIEGFTNNFIVQDRYNKNLSDRIDIFFDKHEDAKKFGVKHNVKVTIYEVH